MVAHPVNRTRGFHDCPFCAVDENAPLRFGIEVEYRDKPLYLGSAEIHVKAKNGIVYAAPDLIYHYITTHHYLPPQEFLDALVAS